VGYHVLDVVVDGVSKGPQTSWMFTGVTGNHTISATFAINVYTITASAGPNGSLSPSGAVAVNYGASQLFEITAAAGYAVDSLLIDGLPVPPATSYEFTNVTANRSIRVTFKKAYVCGDINKDGVVTSSDIIYLVNHVFKSGPPPDPMQVGDTNCSGTVTSADIILLINFVFKSGSLSCCP
jgi:hypothetical protein